MPKKNTQRPYKANNTPAKPTVADKFDPYIEYDQRNQLPISHQQDRLNTYVDDRNEPKPPPSTILSNVKFNQPVRPPVKVDIDNLRGATGSGVKAEETKPTSNWFNRSRTNNSIPVPYGIITDQVSDKNGNVDIQKPTTTSIYNSPQLPRNSKQTISFSTILNQRKPKPNPNNYTMDFPPLSSSSTSKDVQATNKTVIKNTNTKEEQPSSSSATKVELSNVESQFGQINLISCDEIEKNNLEAEFKEPKTFLADRIGKEVNIVMLNVNNLFDFQLKAAEVEDIKRLEELESEMFQFYKNETEYLATEVIPLAFYVWCPRNDPQQKAKRVHFREGIDDSRVKVHLIDHGKDIEVERQHLYKLISKFTKLPRMCVKAKCNIHSAFWEGFGTTEEEIVSHLDNAEFRKFENETGIFICPQETFQHTIRNGDLEIDETGFIVEFSGEEE